MKTISILIAACILSLNIFAGDVHPDKYCVTVKDGKKVVLHEGVAMAMDVTLANGTKVQKDGTIVKPDGTMIILNAGECIDKDGIIAEDKKDK